MTPRARPGYKPWAEARMYLGRVIGTVVATRRYRDLDGYRFLVVQPLCHDLTPRGNAVVAVDAVQAGPGEVVYLVSSREASQALPEPFVPVDAAIVGIVDSVDLLDNLARGGTGRVRPTRSGSR